MRKIKPQTFDSTFLCRAKRIDNGEWVEGYYLPEYYITKQDKAAAICYNDHKECRTYRVPVDPATVGRCTGKEIIEYAVTDPDAYTRSRTVWQDDVIAIYSIDYDDSDYAIHTLAAAVRVKWDDEYSTLYFSDYVYGCQLNIVVMCDIDAMDFDCEYPFSYFLEYMRESNNDSWEWAVAGNIHDNTEILKESWWTCGGQ